MYKRCVDSTVPKDSRNMVALAMIQGYIPRYLEGMK